MKYVLLIALVAICLPSCYVSKITSVPINDEMNVWIGKSSHQLLISMGVPNNSFDDGDSGKIFRYEYTTYQTVSVPAMYYSGVLVPGESSTYSNTSFKEFFVGKTGIIYNWRTNIATVHTERNYDKDRSKAAIIFSSMGIALFILITSGS